MRQRSFMPALLLAFTLFCLAATAQVTGSNVTYVEYNGGNFTLKEDGKWREQSPTNVFSFKETRRDECCVYLYDAFRKMSVQFNIGSKLIYFATAGNSSWSKLYDITGTRDVPFGYTKIADENGEIKIPNNEKYHLAYGANGKFAYKYFRFGTVKFDNKTFGDPIPGVVKAGYYKVSPVQARSESGD